MLRRSLLFGLLLTACAATAAHARPVRSLLEYRQEGVVIQKWDNSCGAAALATVLTYHLNRPTTETAVAQGMLRQTEPLRVRHRGGFSLLDMKQYLVTVGLDGSGYSGLAWDDLPRYTPSIVPIKVRGYDHFVVVRGITATHAEIADPGFGNYRLTKAELLEAWTSGIAFVVTTGERAASHEEAPSGRYGDGAVGSADGGLRTDVDGGSATPTP